VETGYTCTFSTTGATSVCTEVCGGGIDLGTFSCNDGNTLSGDGCSSTCVVETGYVCYGGG
jgi:cysteine-rich repeat protein